ncbi:hypothetical protein EW146_g7918 [Bondarzewia mesenterica]|uniref:Uncharacterized protein n=1 Tax=Bondarzewia mesenterica TaxID=1095465 RepID=A0A4S4LIE6_9AGAM|nr:hypothetical protein EW146_g7918 [Bondarzewia mesenterica]
MEKTRGRCTGDELGNASCCTSVQGDLFFGYGIGQGCSRKARGARKDVPVEKRGDCGYEHLDERAEDSAGEAMSLLSTERGGKYLGACAMHNVDKENNVAKQHLIDMLCMSGFDHDNEWGFCAAKPSQCCISSIALILLKIGIVHSTSPMGEQQVAIDYNQMSTAQKLLLFWCKLVCKCEWDGIEIDLPPYSSSSAEGWAKVEWPSTYRAIVMLRRCDAPSKLTGHSTGVMFLTWGALVAKHITKLDKVCTPSDVSSLHSISHTDVAHTGTLHFSARTGASSMIEDGDMRENESGEAMEDEDVEIEDTKVEGTQIEEIEDGEVLEQAV